MFQMALSGGGREEERTTNIQSSATEDFTLGDLTLKGKEKDTTEADGGGPLITD